MHMYELLLLVHILVSNLKRREKNNAIESPPCSLLLLLPSLEVVHGAGRGLWHVQRVRLGLRLRPVQNLQERRRLGAHPRVDIGLKIKTTFTKYT